MRRIDCCHRKLLHPPPYRPQLFLMISHFNRNVLPLEFIYPGLGFDRPPSPNSRSRLGVPHAGCGLPHARSNLPLPLSRCPSHVHAHTLPAAKMFSLPMQDAPIHNGAPGSLAHGVLRRDVQHRPNSDQRRMVFDWMLRLRTFVGRCFCGRLIPNNGSDRDWWLRRRFQRESGCSSVCTTHAWVRPIAWGTALSMSTPGYGSEGHACGRLH